MKKLLFFVTFAFLFSCTTATHEKPAIKNGAVPIAYTMAGNSDTAIVFIHGWCINKSYWQAQEDLLKERFTVVAPDLGGHGESGHNRNSWTVNDFASDVIAVINGLHLNKVILAGHSMGGDIILRVADSIPSRIIGFIGIDNFKDAIPTSYTPEVQAEIDSFFVKLKADFDTVATAFGKTFLFPPGYADTASVNRVVSDIQSSDSVMATAALESLSQSVFTEPAMLSRLRVPFHLIVSDYTPTDEAAIKQYLKTPYSVKIIKGTGHYPMIEKPAEFNALLLETLNEISVGK